MRAHRALAGRCLRAGLLEEAEAAVKKALDLNPQGELAHCYLGMVYLAQRRLEDAQETFQQEGHDTFRLLGLALVHHARGRPAESDAALRELIEKNAVGGAYHIAEGYAYRGEANCAFKWLERAYTQRNPGLGMMKVSPLLRNLHADPRWQLFLEKMGLAD